MGKEHTVGRMGENTLGHMSKTRSLGSGSTFGRMVDFTKVNGEGVKETESGRSFSKMELSSKGCGGRTRRLTRIPKVIFSIKVIFKYYKLTMRMKYPRLKHYHLQLI